MFESTELLISIMTLVVLVILFASLYFASKKNPDMQIGELITYALVKRSWDGFMISIILLGIFEALTAASIQPVGEAEINPFVRTCGHAVITFIYVVAGVNFPVQLYRFFMSIMNKAPWAKIVAKFTLALGYALIALLMPLVNLFTVASGIKQHHELMMLFMEWLNNAQFCREYYLSVGLPEDYSPWGNMQQILQVDTLITLLVHPLLILLDGIHAFGTGSATTKDLIDEKVKDKELDGKEKKKLRDDAKEKLKDVKDPLDEKAKKSETNSNAAIEMVENILEFYGMGADARKKRASTLIARTYDKYAKEGNYDKQEKVLQTLSQLLVDVKDKKLSDDKKVQLKQRIQAEFRKAPADGGFGEDLPSFK